MSRKRNSRKKTRGRQFLEVLDPKTADVLVGESETMLLESTCRLLEKTDPKGLVWRVCVIETGMSQNGRFYPASTLRKAVPLFEGATVNAFKFDQLGNRFDHLPDSARRQAPGGCVRNQIGVLRPGSVRFEKLPGGGEGITADLVLVESATDIVQILLTRYAEGVQKTQHRLGFSIDSQGKLRQSTHNGRRVPEVSSLHAVESLDLVSHPAAGGRLLRLVASVSRAQGGNMLRVLDFIRGHMPHWCEGVDADLEKSTVGDIVTNILGTTQQRMLASLAKAEAGSAEYREAAHVLAGLQQLMELLADGDIEAAMELLGQMIEMQAEEEAAAEEPPEPAPEPEMEEAASAPPATVKQTEADHPSAHEEDEEEERRKREKEKAAMSEATTEAKLAALERELAESRARQRVTEALSGSGLPAHAQNRIRTMFDGKLDATDKQVAEAVTAEKEYLASISESGKVTGCGKPEVSVGAEQRDRWAKAMYAMIRGRFEHEGVPAFRSLHESYRKMTGHSGCNDEIGQAIFQSMARCMPASLPIDMFGEKGDRVFENHARSLRESFGSWNTTLRESLLTTTWPETFGVELRRALVDDYKDLSEGDHMDLVTRESMLNDVREQHRVRIGGFGDLSTVAEAATYTEIADSGEEEVLFTPTKRGNIKSYSLEAAIRDDLGAIQRISSMLAQSAARTFIKDVTLTNFALNPTMDYDATALVAVGHSNSQTAALSEATLQTAITQILKQTELSSGERLGLSPTHLWVPPDLADLGYRLVTSDVAFTTDQNATVPSSTKGLYGIALRVLKFFTDTADWFLTSSDAPLVEVGYVGSRTPELQLQDAATQGTVFTADLLTWKVRFWWAAEMLDHRGVAGSIVP